MSKRFFATKPLSWLTEEASDAAHGLKRALRAVDLVMLGVGGIIGAGIFVLTGHAAAAYAGPAIVISMIGAAIACGFAGLCYAEMASMIPLAGSAYTYSYATLGELIAWIIGWDLVLEYALGASTVAVGWSGYMVSFLSDFGIVIPPRWTVGPLEMVTLDGGAQVAGLINLPAMLIVGLVTALLTVGIKESAWFNTLIVFLKVTVVLLFVGAGIAYINTKNWIPFIPAATPDGKYGYSGVLTGAGVIFFAYIGFDAVSTAAQEAKNPQRDMPIGILGSLFICTILYIAVALVLTGIVPYTSLNVPDPMAVGINATGLVWLRFLVKVGSIAGLSSVILVLLYGQSRIFWCMANDGLLPVVFKKVHSKFRTPYVTTLLVGIVVAITAGLFPIGVLGEMVSIGTLFAFVLVCAGVWVLRYSRPAAHRPFRAPLIWFVSPAGMLCCLALMAGLPHTTWIRLVIWMIIGLVVYACYGFKFSRLKDYHG